MAIPIELSAEPLQEPVASCDTAISCLARLSMQNGSAARITAARRRIDLASETLPLSRLVKLAAAFGLQAEWIQLDWQGLKTAVVAHPVLIVRKNTDVVVVTGGGRSGAEEVSVWDPHHDGVVFFVAREDFEGGWSGHALIITPEDADANVFKLRPGHETAPDTGGDTSPTPPDKPKQQTPPSPMRTARASKPRQDIAAFIGSAPRLCGNRDCGDRRYRTLLAHAPRRRPQRAWTGRASSGPGHIGERKGSRALCRRGRDCPSRADLRSRSDFYDGPFRWTGK